MNGLIGAPVLVVSSFGSIGLALVVTNGSSSKRVVKRIVLRSFQEGFMLPVTVGEFCQRGNRERNEKLELSGDDRYVPRVIQRPLLPVAMIYLAGVLLGNFVPFPLGKLFLLTLTVA